MHSGELQRSLTPSSYRGTCKSRSQWQPSQPNEGSLAVCCCAVLSWFWRRSFFLHLYIDSGSPAAETLQLGPLHTCFA